MKRIIALLTSLLVILTVFSGCGTSKKDSAKSPDEKKMTVGVIQFASHPSLDNCYKGVEQALKEAFGDDITIDLQNGNADSPTCDSIAINMVAKNYDMIIPIATPAALSAYAAVKNTNIPVVFCAVSDPIAAGLAKSLDKPESNCTGTSDILNLDAQVELIKSMQPDVKKIGVLYTTSEANSVSQLKLLEKIADKQGIKVIAQGVQGASDIPQAASSLCAKVDCINNFTDNNVVNNLIILLEQANTAGIPVYGSEVEQVANGCLASESIDYVALGNKTGEMAAEILKGADVTGIAPATIKDTAPVINTDVAAAFKIEIPDAYKNAEFVTTSKE